MANKVEVFNKLKDIHHRSNVAAPQILLSLLKRELEIDRDELKRHLEALHTMGLIKFKGSSKGAVELTTAGLSTNMKMAVPKVIEERMPERV